MRCKQPTLSDCYERCSEFYGEEIKIWTDFQDCCNQRCGFDTCYFTTCNSGMTIRNNNCDLCISANCCDQLDACQYTDGCANCLSTPTSTDCANNAISNKVFDCSEQCEANSALTPVFNTADADCGHCVSADCTNEWDKCVFDPTCSRYITQKGILYPDSATDRIVEFEQCVASRCSDKCEALLEQN